MQPLFFSIPEISELTGLGRTKVYQLIANGELKIKKVGKRTLIAASDLQRWADELPTRELKAGNRRNPQREAA